MVNTGKVGEIKFNTEIQRILSAGKQEQDENLFEYDLSAPVDAFNSEFGNSDWNNNLTAEYNKLGLGSYTWTKINSFSDAVIKAQDNIIDFMRMYEGHEPNYEAKMQYTPDPSKPENKVYGFGLTRTAMEAIGGKYNESTKTMSNVPKSQTEAYEQMLKYFEVVAKELRGDGKKDGIMSRSSYDKLSGSMKAALFDYHYVAGGTLMREKSGLKDAIDVAVVENTAEKWSVVLRKLVWPKRAIRPFDSQPDNPGIYKRCLSRVIMAAKGIKKDMSAADAAIIDKVVKEVYDEAVKCSKNNNNRGLFDIEEIYQAYTGNKTVSATSPETEQNKYKVPNNIGLFTAAGAIMPNPLPSGVDSKALRSEIIREIARLNGIKINGADSNGWPNPERMLSQGEEVILPDSVTVNRIRVKLVAPEGWEPLFAAQASDVQPEGESEAGTYTVKAGDTWWSIARVVATEDYTDHQINALQQQIADYNNNVELHPGMIIKIPPENYVDPSEGESGELGITESNLTNMIKNMPYESGKVGKTDFEEVTFEYSLKGGETIYRLAITYGIDYKELLKQNGITEREASNLAVGAKIKIKKYAYTAKNDDTIENIAQKYGLPTELLQMVNGNIKRVKKGDKIEIPGSVYTAVKGDSWTKIAQKFSVSVNQLQKINGSRLSRGQKVFIPQSISAVESVNADMPVAHVSSSVKQNVENSLRNVGNRKYLKPENVIYGSDGKVQCLRAVVEPTGSGKLNGKTILVNAGHGLKKNGTLDQGNPGTGSTTLPPEWLVAYDNAERLIERLTKQGAKVILISGNERPEHLARDEIKRARNKADMFISVHTNSSDNPPPRDRAEIYYSAPGAKGRRLANLFETKLDNYQNNREYANSNGKGLNVLVAAENKGMPGILWEIAFQNCKSGCDRLANTALMDKYSDMLVESVVAYFNTPADTRPRYTVKRGDTLSSIAQKFHTTVAELKRLNGLRSDTIRVGQQLIISSSGTGNGNASSASATTGTTQSSGNGEYITHTVKRGETLISIASKYNVTVSNIKKWNNLRSDNIQIGQKLKIKKQ